MITLHLANQAHEVKILECAGAHDLVSEFDGLGLPPREEQALDSLIKYANPVEQLVGTHEHAYLLVVGGERPLHTPVHRVDRGEAVVYFIQE